MSVMDACAGELGSTLKRVLPMLSAMELDMVVGAISAQRVDVKSLAVCGFDYCIVRAWQWHCVALRA